MIKSSIELIAENIGFDIANSDDHVQANLLNGLGKGFKNYSEHNLDVQLCYISSKLSDDAKKLLIKLTEYLR